MKLDVTTSRTRENVYRYVTARPGVSVAEVAKHLQSSWGATHYHVRRLVEEGRLRSVRIGRRRLLLPAAVAAPTDMEARTLLLDPARRAIALALAERGEARAAELAARGFASARAVYHHLQRLRDAGLATARVGRAMRFAPTAALLALLVEVE